MNLNRRRFLTLGLGAAGSIGVLKSVSAQANDGGVVRVSNFNELRDALVHGGEIEILAGAVIELRQTLVVGSNTRLFCSSANPAIIKRGPSAIYCLCINGVNIGIENITFDFNGWQDYAAGIAFKLPDYYTGPRNPRANVVLSGCTFIDSVGVQNRSTKDSWAIVLTNDSTTPLRDIKILGCRQLAPSRQLVAGGDGPGIEGMEIAWCYCQDGRTNSISMSNRGGPSGFSYFRNVNIHNNRIVGAWGIGIFMGRDGQGESLVTIENVVIRSNSISMGNTSDAYPSCIYLRPTKDMLNVRIEDNILHTSKCGPHQNPRSLVLILASKNEGDVALVGNELFGQAKEVINGLIKVKRS